MKLAILDRDGVINLDSADYIKSAEEWLPLPGSIEAMARLSRAGYTVVVATNQSGLGRGFFDLDDLEAMHAKMANLVEAAGGTVDGIFYCPHTPEDNCRCRKPAPGLLDAIAESFEIDLNGVPVVGDSLRDLKAGLARGCRPLLVRTGKGQTTAKQLAESEQFRDIPVFPDLAAAVDFLLTGKARCS